MAVSIVLVGVGGYGAYLWELLRDEVPQDSFDVVAIVDPYRTSSRVYDEVKELPGFDTLDEYFSSDVPRADLAVIATPIPLHREQTIQCLEHGLHVMCEKPPAALLCDLQAMIEASEKAGRLLGFGFQWSYYKEILDMKKDIMNERFGPVKLAKCMVCWPRSRSYYQGTWRGHVQGQDGTYILDSVLSNATAHYLHNLFFLCGPRWNEAAMPESMHASLYRVHDIESYDTVSLDIGISDERAILYSASHAVDTLIEPKFEIICERGKFGVDRNDPKARFYAEDADGNRTYYGTETYSDQQNSQKLQWLIRGAQEFKDSGKLIDLPCEGKTAIPHMTVVNALAFNTKIKSVPKEFVQEVDNEVMQGPTIRYLAKAMSETYEYNKPLGQCRLPGLVFEEEVSLDLEDTPALGS